jgi:hypothetical protein
VTPSPIGSIFPDGITFFTQRGKRMSSSALAKRQPWLRRKSSNRSACEPRAAKSACLEPKINFGFSEFCLTAG